MRCNNCGKPLSPGDTYCSYCGAKVYYHNSATEHNTMSPRQDSSYGGPDNYHDNYRTGNHRDDDGNGKSWLIIAVAVIAALAIVGGALYLGMSHQDEESLWAQCEQSKELADYKKYMDEYPDGAHYADAKMMYTTLINEKGMWEQVQSSNDEFQLRTFIKNHPDSKYLSKAKDLLDDVMWNSVLEKNSRLAIQDYMREFPSGKHIGEARSRFEELRRAELTVEERERVKSSVQQFLAGLESWSLPAMTSVCNTQMRDFMGKHSAGLDDVREYFNAYRESDIDSISFASLAVDVAKSLDASQQPQFSLNFTVTRHFWRNDGSAATTSLMQGRGVVDSYFRFVELSMDKVQDTPN